MNFKSIKQTLAVSAFLLIPVSGFSASLPASPRFDIVLNLDGSALTQRYSAYFEQAVTFWESVITGYVSGATDSSLQGIKISATVGALDNVRGGTLGFGATTSSYAVSSSTAGFQYSRTGALTFDALDVDDLIASGSFVNLVKHEIAHVIGFGNQWEANGLHDNDYNDPEPGVPGQYLGQFALAAYRSEFGQAGASYVPVELDGGTGTRYLHWNENANGSGATGIVDARGRDMRDELMTGWLNPNAFVSKTTVESFRDLGYTVNYAAIQLPPPPVPVPGVAWLFASCVTLLGYKNARRTTH